MALPPVVRSPQWPVAPQPGANTPAPQADARKAAQKAFFEAALAGKAPPATAARIDRAAEAVRAVSQTEAQTTAARLPKPGSIIDIWV